MSREDKIVEVLKILGELEDERKLLTAEEEQLDAEYAETVKKFSEIDENRKKLVQEKRSLDEAMFNQFTRNYSFVEEGRTEEGDMYPSSRWETTYYDFYGMSITSYTEGFYETGNFTNYKFNDKLANYTDERLLERAKEYINEKIDELTSILVKENDELEKYIKEKQDLEKQYSETSILNFVKKAQLSRMVKECDQKIQQKQERIDGVQEKLDYWLGKTDESVLIQIKEIKSSLQNYFIAVQEIEKKRYPDYATNEQESKKTYNEKKEDIQKRKNKIKEKEEKALTVMKSSDESLALVSKIASDSKVDKKIKETAVKVEQIIRSKKNIKK